MRHRSVRSSASRRKGRAAVCAWPQQRVRMPRKDGAARELRPPAGACLARMLGVPRPSLVAGVARPCCGADWRERRRAHGQRQVFASERLLDPGAPRNQQPALDGRLLPARAPACLAACCRRLAGQHLKTQESGCLGAEQETGQHGMQLQGGAKFDQCQQKVLPPALCQQKVLALCQQKVLPPAPRLSIHHRADQG